MNLELKKRIITSFILILLSLFIIFIHPYLFIAGILIFSYIAFDETISLSLAIFKRDKKKIIKGFFFNGASLFYFVIFSATCIILYNYYGPLFFLFILLISSSSDIGGYVFGKSIGGLKLTKISPKKTISGSIGSFFFSVIPLIVFNYFYADQNLHTLNNFIFCLLISFATQIGDIFFSFLKRKANRKDTGKLLPGHGGLLDRIDGIILAIPCAYLLITNFNFFN